MGKRYVIGEEIIKVLSERWQFHVYQNSKKVGRERRNRGGDITASLLVGVDFAQKDIAQCKAANGNRDQAHDVGPHVPGRSARIAQIVQVETPQFTTM